MVLSRRRMLTLAASATVALSLGATAACGSAGPGGSSATSPNAATMWALTGSTQSVIQGSVDQWNKAHPDQQIKVDYFANDAFKTKVRTAVGAGQGPTLLWSWGGGVLDSYVKAGQVEPLDSFITTNPQVRSRYIPSVLDSGILDGKTYALPNNNVQPIVLYYNKALFDKIGVQPPKTWDELMALVPKFNAAGIAPFSLAGQSKWPNLMWLEYLTDRIGGPQTFKKIAANQPGAWSDPAVIEALTKIQQLVDANGFVKGFSSIAADNSSDQALLFSNKAAMVLHGGWIYTTMKQSAPQFVSSGLGYVPFPAVAGGAGDPTAIVGNPANFWSVSSKATDEQQKTALAYLKDGLFTDTYTDGLIQSGLVPAVTGTQSKLGASQDKDFLDYEYSLVTKAPTFQLSWDQALSPAQAAALLTNLDLIFIKQSTPQQFADAMNATVGK